MVAADPLHLCIAHLRLARKFWPRLDGVGHLLEHLRSGADCEFVGHREEVITRNIGKLSVAIRRHHVEGVSWNPKTHEIRAGQFDVQAGFEHWLIKFDGVGPDKRLGVSRDYGRIEYAYHLMARAAGINCQQLRQTAVRARLHVDAL